MKMSKNEIQELLAKAVSSAMEDETPTAADNKLEKTVTVLAKQVQTLTELASNNFEKPKSAQEIIQEALAPITKQIQDLAAKVNPTPDESQPIPQTKGELSKMIEDVITKALNKTNNPAEPPKGKGKDDLGKNIANMDDNQITNLIKEVNGELMIGDEPITADLAKETTDAAGNTLTDDKLKKRAALDNFFGKAISGSRNVNHYDDDDDNDDNDDNGKSE